MADTLKLPVGVDSFEKSEETDFWRLSLEHDQYKGYSSCQRKEGKFLPWHFTWTFRI